MEVPMGQWIHVEISARLGPQSKGRWDLAVTRPGQATQSFKGLPNRHAQWKSLHWLGFCAVGQEGTFYLDNIELANTAAR